MNTSKTLHSLLFLALILCTLLIYSDTLSFDFVYDDDIHIKYNELLDENLNITSASKVLKSPTPPGDLYRPATSLTYLIENSFFGLQPVSFHAVNLFIYLICITLAYHCFLCLLGSPITALFCAAFFAFHPVHVEAVANIVGRAELLAAMGVFSACLIAISSLRSTSNAKWFLGSVLASLFLLFAALSKESAITGTLLVPLFLISAERWEFFTKKKTKLLFTTVCILAAGIISILARYAVLQDEFIISSTGEHIYPENPIFHLPFNERIVPALYILGRYVSVLLLPLKLSADYSEMPASFFERLDSSLGYSMLALFALVLILSIFSARRKYGLGGFWFFISIALTCNLFTPIGTLMAERLAFLPSFGVILLFVGWFSDAYSKQEKKGIVIPIASLGICILFFSISWMRIEVWRNEATLFKTTTEDAPNSPKAWYNYGSWLYENGRYAGAEKNLEKALELNPDDLLTLQVMADTMLARKKYRELENYYRKILLIDPDNTAVQDRLKKLSSYRESNKDN